MLIYSNCLQTALEICLQPLSLILLLPNINAAILSDILESCFQSDLLINLQPESPTWLLPIFQQRALRLIFSRFSILA